MSAVSNAFKCMSDGETCLTILFSICFQWSEKKIFLRIESGVKRNLKGRVLQTKNKKKKMHLDKIIMYKNWFRCTLIVKIMIKYSLLEKGATQTSFVFFTKKLY